MGLDSVRGRIWPLPWEWYVAVNTRQNYFGGDLTPQFKSAIMHQKHIFAWIRIIRATVRQIRQQVTSASCMSNDLRDPELCIASFGRLLKMHLFQQYSAHWAD